MNQGPLLSARRGFDPPDTPPPTARPPASRRRRRGLVTLCLLLAGILGSDLVRAQTSLPAQLFLHGPSSPPGSLAIRCLDAVPASVSGRPRATIDHSHAWFESRHGSSPDTDCVPFGLPARIPAGTKLRIYLYVTLSGSTTIDYIVEVVSPGAVTTVGQVTQAATQFWNLAEIVTATDFVVPSNGYLRLRVERAGVLRYDLDETFSPTGGLVGPQGYPGVEVIEPPEVQLLVGSFSGNVLRYDGATGAFFDEFVPPGAAGLDVSLGIAIGPDGNLYVSSRDTDNVLEFHGATGAFIDRFNPGAVLNEPSGLSFGPDGHLYVSSAATDAILRFDISTHLLIDVFAGGGALSLPEGLAFGPDGHLYVSSALSDTVLRYHGTTGAFLGVFASGGGLDHPIGLTFGPDGDLYVASHFNDRVLRYDGGSGAFLGVFAQGGGLAGPVGLRFGPDGHLYVVSQADDRILRYHATTGAFLGVFAIGSGNDLWTWFTFRPEPGVGIFADGFESGDTSAWSSTVP